MVSNWSHKAEIEDTAIANVKFASGALCNLQLSICDRRLNYRQISGEKATVVYQDEKNANSQIPDVFRLGRFATPMRQFIAGGGEIAGQNEIEWEDVAVGGRGEGSTLLESFVSAIRDGSKLITDGVSARRTLELINGIVLSGVRKKVVSLPVDRAEYDELMNELQSGRTQVERVFS